MRACRGVSGGDGRNSSVLASAMRTPGVADASTTVGVGAGAADGAGGDAARAGAGASDVSLGTDATTGGALRRTLNPRATRTSTAIAPASARRRPRREERRGRFAEERLRRLLREGPHHRLLRAGPGGTAAVLIGDRR